MDDPSARGSRSSRPAPQLHAQGQALSPGMSPHDISMRLPAAALISSRLRTARCERALHHSLSDLEFTQAEDQHMLAIVRGSNCRVCGSLQRSAKAAAAGGCTHARMKFNSTKNSKRHVHTFLFWKRWLGFVFPISDAMLQEPVWKSLVSCGSGIKGSNGHPLRPSVGVCINPFHYAPSNWTTVLDALQTELGQLGLGQGDPTVASLLQTRSTAQDDGLLFQALCSYLRAAALEEDTTLAYHGDPDVAADGSGHVLSDEDRPGLVEEAEAPEQGLGNEETEAANVAGDDEGTQHEQTSKRPALDPQPRTMNVLDAD